MGNVQKAPLSGGSATSLGSVSSSGSFGPESVAVDANAAYWSNGFSVIKLPLSGGAPVTLTSSSGGVSVAVDATSVYWATATSIMKMAVGGGSPTSLVTGLKHGFVVAVDANDVYFTDVEAGRVMKTSK